MTRNPLALSRARGADMSVTIWKYELPVQDTALILMPARARVLSVMVQGAAPFLWALVDTQAELEVRTFYVRGTGHPLGDAEDAVFVGSFMLFGGSFVGHVFAQEQPR